MGRRFEFVFVDATDTLLRVHGSVGRLYSAAARRHGYEASAETIDAGFRLALAAAPPPCFPGALPGDLARLEREWWHDVVRRTFAPLEAFPRFEAFFHEVFEMFRTTAAWDLLPGARAALETLRAEGRRLGMISDMDGRLLDVLEHLGMRRMFEPVVISTRAGCSKRDGALFPHALAVAGVAPERAVHVGDSLRWDVEGARAAGMAAIHFDLRGDGAAPAGVPAARQWSEIPVLVRSLEERAV